MIKIGLTGSIGMGKSTTAKMFEDEGVPVWDADAAVERLYSKDGKGVHDVQKFAPEAVTEDGVDKDVLKTLIRNNPNILADLEVVIHPLVALDRLAFLEANKAADVILFDIPLLFEKGSDAQMDVVIAVTVAADVQKKRVLSRGTMDEETFNLILLKQLPDAEKRKRADYVIETTSIEHAAKQVQNILQDIRSL